MCGACAVKLAEGGVLRVEERNAYLESLLLHARALHEFLLGRLDKARGTDIVRTDFGPDWDPLAAGEDPRVRSAAEYLAAAVPDMNWHLAHLTWTRVDVGPPVVWTPAEVAHAAAVLLGGWAQHVDRAAVNPLLFDTFAQLHNHAQTIAEAVEMTTTT